MTTGNGGVRFASLFDARHILCQTGITERDQVFHGLLELLAYQRGIGNVDDAYQALLERESEHPTIVGPGIAMPHARLEAIDELVVGVATSREGIAYAGEDGEKVNLLILILTPKTEPGLYLQAVSSLATTCKDPTTAERVSALASPAEVWRFFDRGGMILPEYICAGDVMGPIGVSLAETDTLERAIDLFVRSQMLDLPVIDREGTLVGVVTAQELLRVCMPDYILWMEDLSPIINFEPFAEILRNESNTWLAEIMTTDYAAVQVDAPAIMVAKELTRQHAECCYVLQGKRLAGVITLQDFLDKVMRE